MSRPTASDGGRVCRVQPDVPAVHRAFDYSLPDVLARDVRVGTIVRVPLHGRRVRGWVLDPDVAESEVARLRDVLAVVSAGPPADVVELCRWTAWRWAGPLATLLRAASPPNVVPVGEVPERETAVYPAPAAAEERLTLTSPLVDLAGPAVALVAGEGSTIVLDPDAARAARLVAALEHQGREVVVLRSDQPAAERTAAWDRARAGAHVVVGGRTAVLAPVPDLERVVVLDEADEALEEERAPTWNARDVAFERCARGRRRGADRHPGAHGRRPRRAGHRATRGDGAHLVAAHDRRRPTRRGAGARAALGHTRARAASMHRRRAPRSVRAQPARAGAVARVPDVSGAGPVRAMWRDRAGARRQACLCALRHRAAAGVPALSRHPVPTGATGRHDRPRRPRRVAPAGDGGSGRRDHRRPPRSRRPHRHRGRPPPRPTVPSGSSPSSSSTRSCSRRGRARRSRRSGSSCAPRACWRLTDPGPARSFSRPACPTTRSWSRRATGHPLTVAEAEWARREALGWPPFGGAAELAGDAVAVRAACDALRVGRARHRARPRWQRHARAGTRRDRRCARRRARAPAVDAAHALGRLRVDVDPRRA